MSTIRLEQITGSDTDLKAALTDARLPTDDIEDHGRTFFRAQSSDGRAVGFIGVERCGDDLAAVAGSLMTQEVQVGFRETNPLEQLLTHGFGDPVVQLHGERTRQHPNLWVVLAVKSA